MTITHAGRTFNHQEFVVVLSMDAMRIAFGMKPKTFTLEEVISWLRAMSKE